MVTGAAAALVAAGVLTGCDPGGASPAASCASAVQEPLDPASLRHVLPGAPEPTYTTDPPTSGPHQLGDHPTGVLTEPIPRPVQLGQLEAGIVLVQHRSLEDRERADLERLVGDDVTIAPNPTLPDRVVATAWRFKLTCGGVDRDALRDFIEAHTGGQAPHQ